MRLTEMIRYHRLLLVAVILMGCNSVFYYPLKQHVFDPQDVGLTYEDRWIESSDGVRFHAWYFPATKSPLGTILFLHGNAENISTHFASIAWLPAEGYNVLAIDYRGYGKSEGRASLDGIKQDVEAGISSLLKTPDQKIIILGQSLGGSLAIYAAGTSRQRDQIAAVIAESPFAGYRQIVRDKLSTSWITILFKYPLSWLISDRYSPLKAVRRISPTPLFLIHGDIDEIVPVRHSEELFAVAGEPKTLWIVKGKQHNRCIEDADYKRRVLEFLRNNTTR